MNDGESGPLELALLAILDEAMAVGGATRGNIQFLNRETDALEIRVQRGFDRAFVEHFRRVRGDDGSACGRALRHRRRIAIGDITQDAAFAPFLAIAQQAGFQAVQSTPILAADGRALGVLSTHFPAPQLPSLSEGVMLDHCAARAAQVIERLLPPA